MTTLVGQRVLAALAQMPNPGGFYACWMRNKAH
jgi:hypothetical protein